MSLFATSGAATARSYGAAAPSAPPQQRTGGTRPQSYRYLKETLNKLGEDAIRLDGSAEFENRIDSPEPDPYSRCTTPSQMRSDTPVLRSDTPQPSRSMVSPEPEPGCQHQGKPPANSSQKKVDIDVWRSSFCAEAWDCVRAMQSVVEGGSTGHFVARFEDWRKTDLKATAQVQQHVKELSRLNQALEDFLVKSATPEEFGSFRESLVVLRQTSTDLLDTKTSITENVDLIADRCASRVMKSWAGDMRAASTHWQELRECQQARWNRDDERWSQVDDKLDKLQGIVDRLCGETSQHGVQMDAFQSAQAQANDLVQTTLHGNGIEAGNRAEAAAYHLAGTFRECVVSEHRDTHTHISKLLVGLDEEPLNTWMTTVSDRMQDLEMSAQKEIKQLRDTTVNLQSTMHAQKEDIRTVRSEGSEASRLAASLQENLDKYMVDLKRTKRSLDAATHVSLCNGLRRFKDIESRGNLRLNRQTGDIKLLRPFEFLPSKAKGGETPAAVLKDSEVAASVVADIVEIATFFENPIHMDVNVFKGKAGKLDVCKQQAESRAAVLTGLVSKAGVDDSSRVRIVGQVPEGKGATGVVVRLNKDLFSEEVAGKAKQGARQGSPSPGRSPGRS